MTTEDTRIVLRIDGADDPTVEHPDQPADAERYLCPVCGYPDLSETPWTNESPSDEVCPSCGTHFGYDDVAAGDAAERQQFYRRRRSEWRMAGCQWFSVSTHPPSGWNAERQLGGVDE